jgi:hypothetical protein
MWIRPFLQSVAPARVRLLVRALFCLLLLPACALSATSQEPRVQTSPPLKPSVHEVVSFPGERFSGSGVGSATVSCPAGELALSGGWVTTTGTVANVFESRRTGAGSWRVSIDYTDHTVLFAKLECLRSMPGAEIHADTFPIKKGIIAPTSPLLGLPTSVLYQAGCNNAGLKEPGLVVGAGFSADPGTHFDQVNPEGKVDAYVDSSALPTTAPGDVLAEAECLVDPSHRMHTHAASSGAGVDSTTTPVLDTATCPSGMSVISGGFSAVPGPLDWSRPMRTTLSAAAGAQDQWQVRVSFLGKSPVHLTASALCAGF